MANRLSQSQSPYLKQHQDNPVDWFEWGEQAFEAAQTLGLPILLSIGYAACHWCHVMAHESFEDPAIAQYMNQHFVNIKVDREERPDIDSIYMAATQAIAGHGGWPMTVFLNHELKPYYAGTYFPPTAAHGLPSFKELLEAMSDAWVNQRDLIDQSVEEITEHLQKQNSKLTSSKVERTEVLEHAIAALRQEFDLSHAGFGGAPKFPPHTTLQFLLRYLAQNPNPEIMGWVERTAMRMASGGMYDQIGGGFARYSVDNRWLVPHFEKMLYDNALLIQVYAELASRTNNPRYQKVLSDTVAFVIRELQDERGGFYASLDADSEGEEGKYYVFDQSELAVIFGNKAELAGKVFKVNEIATFEHGKSVLQFDPEIEISAQDFEALQQTLLDYRESRVRPATDKKILTGWNALLIRALLRAASIANDSSAALAAEKALEFLIDNHLKDGKLYRSSLEGELSNIAGQLEDWAALGNALVAAHGYFGKKEYFDQATWVAEQILLRFKADVLYDTESQHTQTPVRPRTLTDSGTPSPHGITAELFRSVWLITGDDKYRVEAELILAELAELMARAPRATSTSLHALVGMQGAREFAVLGPGSRLHEFVLGLPDGGSVISAGLPHETPLLANRQLIDGKPSVYICENFSCLMPVTELEDLKMQLGANS